MLFSVVIPLYNKRDYIKETIESVLSQTYTDFEVIIVNDSSTDDSLAIAQSFDDGRIRIYTKPNGGVSDTRNYGLKKANGEYICFLDADDLWNNNYLKNLTSIISKYPNAGFICGAYTTFKNKVNNIIKTTIFDEVPESYVAKIDFFKESVKRKRIISLTSSVCVRKIILENMDTWFAERVNNGEDADMWVRLAIETDVVYYNKPMMFYRSGTENSLFYNNLSLKNTYHFWNWYSLYSRNTFKDALTTRMIYTTALYCYNSNSSIDGMRCLLKCRGKYLFVRRCLLFVKLLLQSMKNVILRILQIRFR